MKTTVSVRLHNTRQSLCHVCLQCIKGKYRAEMRYYMKSILKKDIRKKPLKAPISNHIYGTLICDLQLLSTKLNLFDSWVGHLNTIFIPQWNSCSVRKKTWEMPKKCSGKEAIGMFKIDCTIIVKPYSGKNCALGGNSMIVVLGLLNNNRYGPQSGSEFCTLGGEVVGVSK